MTIHFKANLRPVVKENLGMLNWVMDPEVSGFIIGYDLGDNQVLITKIDVRLSSFLICHHSIMLIPRSLIGILLGHGIPKLLVSASQPPLGQKFLSKSTASALGPSKEGLLRNIGSEMSSCKFVSSIRSSIFARYGTRLCNRGLISRPSC